MTLNDTSICISYWSVTPVQIRFIPTKAGFRLASIFSGGDHEVHQGRLTQDTLSIVLASVWLLDL